MVEAVRTPPIAVRLMPEAFRRCRELVAFCGLLKKYRMMANRCQLNSYY